MKQRTIKRGLHSRIETIPETWDEVLAQIDEPEPENYLDDVEALARKVLADEGIDPDTLFEKVDESDGRTRSKYVRHTRINQEELSPEADGALTILKKLHYEVRPKLQDANTRSGLIAGIHLAEQVGLLTANLGYRRTVEGRQRSNSVLRDYQQSMVSDDDIREAREACGTNAAAAAKLGLTERHLYRRLEKLREDK